MGLALWRRCSLDQPQWASINPGMGVFPAPPICSADLEFASPVGGIVMRVTRPPAMGGIRGGTTAPVPVITRAPAITRDDGS